MRKTGQNQEMNINEEKERKGQEEKKRINEGSAPKKAFKSI
jgi:hypothetical protein